MDTAGDFESWLAANTGYCKRHRCRLTTAECDIQKAESQGYKGDLRCQGCYGLNNQPEAVDLIGEYGKSTPRLQFVMPITHKTSESVFDEKPGLEAEPVARISEHAETEDAFDLDYLRDLNSGSTSLAQELYTVFFEDEDDPTIFDDESDCLTEDIEEDDLEVRELSTLPETFGTDEHDPFMQHLLMALKEIDEDSSTEAETHRVQIKGPIKRTQKVRVYSGRCMKCEGYMVPAARECHDGITDSEVYRCFNCGWRISPAYNYNRSTGGGTI